MTEPAGDACPYCGTIHPEGVRAPDYYRCHGCNFHIHGSWLVDGDQEWALDSVHALLCPWCGFPAGSEQSLHPDRETPCGGCAGSLRPDFLVTQAELRVDRDLGRRSRHLILAMVTALVFLVIALAVLT